MSQKNKLKARAKAAAARAECEGIELTYCPDSGKICYDTRSEAERTTRDIERTHHGRNLSVYMCNACGCYHVSRAGYEKSKLIRQGKMLNKGRLYE